MKNGRKIERVLFVALPLMAQIVLSFFNELYYFRLMAFVMPIFICGVFVYYLCRYKLRQATMLDMSILVGATYGFGFFHYKIQEAYFTEYTLANNLPLDLDGFAPLIMALIVHAAIYLALAIIIVGIFVFMKVFQQLFGYREETLMAEEDIMEWGAWDDSNKGSKRNDL